MCNAWNHSPGCRCGWGGEGSSGNGGWNTSTSGWINSSGSSGNFSNNILQVIKNKFRPYHSDTCHFDRIIQERENKPKTYKTNCWYCGDEVFYHTNGYGDCVLFDSLGHPWEIHQCWADYCESKKLGKLCWPKIIDLEVNLQKKELINGVFNYLRSENLGTGLHSLCENLGLEDIDTLKKEYKGFYRTICTYNEDSDPKEFNSWVSRIVAFLSPANYSNRTQKSKCYYCQKEIFYHTNEFGDIIIFDELKKSWKIHECWEKYYELSLKNTGKKELEIKVRPSKQVILKRCEKTRKKIVLDGAINTLKSHGLLINLENLIEALGMEDANEFQKEYNELFTIQAIYKKKKRNGGKLK
jgi:hypothetical protein